MRRVGIVMTLASAAMLPGCANGHDEHVTLAEVPAAARETILAHLQGGQLSELERCRDEKGVVYEAAVQRAQGEFEFLVAENGAFLGTEEEEREYEECPAEDGAFLAPTPLRDGASFTARITHPYLPLSRVRYAVLEGRSEKVIREVQDQTRVVGGVECLVLAEKEYANGELAEISYNFFAQDAEGNVFYFGEDVDEYENGIVTGHGGAWLVGRNADEPCLFMPALPRKGLRFKAENSPPEAEEWDEIADLEGELRVPAGFFRDVLVIREGDRPGKWSERKYYASGIGLISENKELNLTVLGREGPGAR